MSSQQYNPDSQAQEMPWSTGLFEGLSDMRTCCLSCLCPCVIFSRIVDIIDKGQTANAKSGVVYAVLGCIGGPCIYSAPYRTKMRNQYNLEGSWGKDCLVHVCCEPCALTQEYHELQNRGFDLKLGWQGNLEKQNGQVATAPVVEKGMKR